MLTAFRYAGRGLLRAYAEEWNFRFHVAVAEVVVASSLVVPIPAAGRALTYAAAALVLAAECLNGAVERAVDLSATRSDTAAAAKDMAAAAVLILAASAVVVGVIVFLPYLGRLSRFAGDHLLLSAAVLCLAGLTWWGRGGTHQRRGAS